MTSASATPEEELHWLALRLVPGLGARTAVKLIERFRTPETVLRAPASELEAAGLPPGLARSIASGVCFDEAVGQQQKIRAAGAVVIPATGPRYPARLRDIFDPPLLLFARGRLELLASHMLAVVGTRRPTPYGLAVTERVAGDLARAGLTVVSGMARGIDTAAHRAALAAAGDTIAVLGCGVDVVYPTENRKLAAEIAAKGLLVSEFPMCSPAYPQNFPIRNRIISGIALGVLVAEGAQYSGSSITARLALDQGREVFAIPGSIVSRMSWGPNLLIKQGAKLVQDWNDVVVELPAEAQRELAARSQARLLSEPVAPETQAAPAASNSTEASCTLARNLLKLLKIDTATHVDELLLAAQDASSSEVIAALFELEMTGAIRQLPGRNFVRVW